MEILLSTYENVSTLENLIHHSKFMTNMSSNLTSYRSSNPVNAHQDKFAGRLRKEKDVSDKMVENIMSRILQDYKTGDCRQTLQQTSISSRSSSLQNTTMINLIVYNINMMFIIMKIFRCS